MRLTILGCCGSIPGPDQAASGYLLEADGFRLGLDLGNGTLARLQTVCDPFELNALVLSHLHPDHCADFSALTVLRRYHPNPPYDPRRHRLPVHAPAEAPTRLANAYAPHEAERQETDLSDVFDFRTLSPEPRRIGPFTVTPVPVLHPTESFGVRITYGDVSFAYTGDTGLCAALDELADGVDVLLCEASWTSGPDRPEGLHSAHAHPTVVGRRRDPRRGRGGVRRPHGTRDPGGRVRVLGTVRSGPVQAATGCQRARRSR